MEINYIMTVVDSHNSPASSSHEISSSPAKENLDNENHLVSEHSAGRVDANGNKVTDAPAESTELPPTEEDIAWAEGCTNNCICGMPDDRAFMIICDKCSDWFHGRCIGLDRSTSRDIVEYHCPRCERQHGPTVFKVKRSSGRKIQQVNYADLNNGVTKRKGKIEETLAKKQFLESPFSPSDGRDFTLNFLEFNGGFTEPVLFLKPDGLDMLMPKSSMTVMEIAELIGDVAVEVMDVSTQETVPDWTLKQWARYFTNTWERKLLLNVISFEVSDTPLADMIQRPRIVREIDWIDKYWPAELKTKGEFPKVQLYCLMSPAGAWTDFHIDFGGSSVFYHLLSGKKTFYMIPPSDINLKQFQQWCQSPDQSHTFFSDLVKICYKIDIEAGNTFIIPSGWIHAVYTEKDAVAIGGNFLHSFAIRNQLTVYNIEQNCRVPPQYRFPFFEKLCWFAASAMDRLEFNDVCSSNILMDGVQDLVDFLYLRVGKLNKQKTTKPDLKVDVSQAITAYRSSSLPIQQAISDLDESSHIKSSIPKALRERAKYKKLITEFAFKLAQFRLGIRDIDLNGVPQPRKRARRDQDASSSRSTSPAVHPILQMPLVQIYPNGKIPLLPHLKFAPFSIPFFDSTSTSR